MYLMDQLLNCVCGRCRRRQHKMAILRFSEAPLRCAAPPWTRHWTAGMRRADRRAVPKLTDMVGGSA